MAARKLVMSGPVPLRPLGATGVEVSILAVGGYHLGDVPREADAVKIVHAALDHGVFFFDNAWTDYLDLWQIHECVYENDPERHYAPGGVLEALRRGYPFDTVQMPINCFDASYRSFARQVVPVARKRRLGILGMKSLSGKGEAVKAGVVGAEECLRYALSQPVSAVISGIDSMKVLHQNLGVAGGFQPMSADEQEALRRRVAPLAADGRFEIYKSSKAHDGDPGRKQHGFPSLEELGG